MLKGKMSLVLNPEPIDSSWTNLANRPMKTFVTMPRFLKNITKICRYWIYHWKGEIVHPANLEMAEEFLGVCRIWKDIIMKNKLIFSSDLIVSSLELTTLHVIFIHKWHLSVLEKLLRPFKCLLVALHFSASHWKIILDFTQDFLEFMTLV